MSTLLPLIGVSGKTDSGHGPHPPPLPPKKNLAPYHIMFPWRRVPTLENLKRLTNEKAALEHELDLIIQDQLRFKSHPLLFMIQQLEKDILKIDIRIKKMQSRMPRGAR